MGDRLRLGFDSHLIGRLHCVLCKHCSLLLLLKISTVVGARSKEGDAPDSYRCHHISASSHAWASQGVLLLSFPLWRLVLRLLLLLQHLPLPLVPLSTLAALH